MFSASSSESEIKLDGLLKLYLSTKPLGESHVEHALNSFIVDGPNGCHFCKVVEPLGASLYSILQTVFERRCDLNEPENWLGIAKEGDG